MSANPIDKDKLIAELQQEVKMLKALVLELMERLAKYENPKNSSNSSLPPSHDFARPLRTKTLREPSGKKPGGQPGHEGATLHMTENPDQLVVYSPGSTHLNFKNFQQEVVIPSSFKSFSPEA